MVATEWGLAVLALLSACGGLSPPNLPVLPGGATTTPTPFQPVPATYTPTAPPITPTPSPDPNRLVLWLGADLPQTLVQNLASPTSIRFTDTREDATLELGVVPDGPLSRWVYVAAAAFPSPITAVSANELQQAWRGDNRLVGKPLLMSPDTAAVFTAWWGAPGAEALAVLPAVELLDYAWQNRPQVALLPFEALEPRWKALPVDGGSPLRKGFSPDAYPLSVPLGLRGQPGAAALLQASLAGAEPWLPSGNYEPDRLTSLAMTGVTALVRATAFTMEQRGMTYPAQDIGSWLAEADLTHISNEVPFAANCPFPNPVQADVRFCSRTKYIQLLEAVGTDIVELTGDHFQDWGREAMYYTLEQYDARGWQYYGGGADLEAGRKALLVEHNGNRLAFIGCNGKGGGFAQAGPNSPGAVRCDLPWMSAEIARLREEGYLPIATFQHFEYYTYRAQPAQERDFRQAAAAGAVIVSGSQAHQPQAFEFHAGALIHYGLGNLFFDQYEISLATRQGFIDRHVFYAGRYLGVELLPIMFIDYARPRPMTAAEETVLLEAVFSASGW